jgi:hypothetical protein
MSDFIAASVPAAAYVSDDWRNRGTDYSPILAVLTLLRGKKRATAAALEAVFPCPGLVPNPKTTCGGSSTEANICERAPAEGHA